MTDETGYEERRFWEDPPKKELSLHEIKYILSRPIYYEQIDPLTGSKQLILVK